MFQYLYEYFFSSTNEGYLEDTSFEYDDETFDTQIQVKNATNNCKGCFATQDIENGYYIQYRGDFVEENPNNENSWALCSYDHDIGEITNDHEIIGYIDGDTANHWTKHIGYTVEEEMSNITVRQYGDNIYYIVSHNIKEGEEILMHCSEEYYNHLNAVDA